MTNSRKSLKRSSTKRKSGSRTSSRASANSSRSPAASSSKRSLLEDILDEVSRFITRRFIGSEAKGKLIYFWQKSKRFGVSSSSSAVSSTNSKRSRGRFR